MDPLDLRTRSLSELLDAERVFRQQAEARVRALNAILTDLAYRYGGDRLEQLRKQDSSAPSSWTPDQWRNFFQALTLDPDSSSWDDHARPKDGNGNGHRAELEKLEEEIKRLKAELAEARELAVEKQPSGAKKLSQVLATPLHPSSTREWGNGSGGSNGKEVVEKTDIEALGLGYAHISLADFTSQKIPANFASRIKSESSTDRDSDFTLRRAEKILWVMAVTGISALIEINRIVGKWENISAEAGSIKRVIANLAKSNLIIQKTLGINLSTAPTRLVVARLSEDGKTLCKLLGYPIVESDWERINRLHEGGKQEGHTLAVLLFTAHARMRGWKAKVLPEITESPARPDVFIENDQERWYVEVETGTRVQENNAKWLNLAQLQDGKIALCARTSEERKVLVSDCLRWKGVATDLESLVLHKMKEITPGAPLWMETWNLT